MRKFLNFIVPSAKLPAAFFVVSVASLLLFALFNLGYLLSSDAVFLYGLGIFLAFPFFIGIVTPLTIGYKNSVTWGESVLYSQLALLGVGVSLLFLAVEGLICIVMSAPFVCLATLIGSLVGHTFQSKRPKNDLSIFGSFALFLFLVPAATVAEKRIQPSEELTPIVTSVVIAAAPETVWKNVAEFPELAPPTEWMFKTGVAYPIRARLVGSGVGAVRYCEFSTGAFVEPITTWNENELLQFSVEEQPLPMREVSPYGELDTTHLHDYFVSRKGQFKLTRLENGNTLLEGTTWYYHKIKPEFYWHFWTEQIVHTIHLRVLNHIKEQSEKAN